MSRPIKSPKPKGESNPELINPEINKPAEIDEDTNPIIDDSLDEGIDDEFGGGIDDEFGSGIDDDFGSGIDDDFGGKTPSPLGSIDEEETDEVDKDQDILYEYHPNRSYLFIFGPKSAGKTVIIGSILKYLKSYRSKKFGDTLMNINDKSIIYEREGNKLWKELTDANVNNEFPSGTQNVEATKVFHNNPAPRHLNLKFSPASNHTDFSFCIMDMAGEDLSKVDYESNAPLPSSIRTYIEDVPKQNMCFIYVLDPLCESLKKSQQIALFEAFIENLDTNGHTATPLLIIVSKWDVIKSKYNDINNFLDMEYDDISGYSHQANRDISVLEYSIGEVHDNKPVRFDHTYPERLFNWLYSNQTGYDLKSEVMEPEKSWINKYIKKRNKK